jgi:Na+/H+ antiporter NhaA
MVGLLAAVGTAMSALVGLAHGDLVWAVVTESGVAAGLAAYLAAAPANAVDIKKSSRYIDVVYKVVHRYSFSVSG